MKQATSAKAPFDVREGRVMVSLGPLTRRKHCPYSCPFCYVRAGFAKYSFVSIPDTVRWIRGVRQPYDVIYVSGDTDSFAPPRTAEGLALLTALLEFNTDLLFTTRAVLDDGSLDHLGEIARELNRRGNRMIACVSVAQLSVPRLEPRPMAPPLERLEQLKRFRSLGAATVLAMRPFLPVVPVSDYTSLVNFAKGAADIILGEAWYVDEGGILERAVLGAPAPAGLMQPSDMDFNDNSIRWKTYEPPEVIEAVTAECERLGIPFFMRSRPALDWLRGNQRIERSGR
jgi:hypothetical protein